MSKPHFHVTAGLLWKDGKLLITKRPQGSHLAGFWEFPGGKQEPNESLEKCLEREIKEELGIAVKVQRSLLQVDHEYENKSISLHLFHCSIISGEPRPLGCDGIKWVLPEDLSEYPLPPPDYLVLPHLKEWCKSDGMEQDT
jgi:mutator protein MutT